MTFQQLTYAVEVARYASINKAAEHLYTHQSNVSNLIRQLEDELGIQIFFRTQKGVQLTEAGREFLVYAKELVEKKSFLEQLYMVRNQQEAIRFTVSSMRSFFAYAPLIEINRQQDLMSVPLNVRMRKCSLKEVIEDVSSGIADVGVIFAMESRRSRLPQISKIKNIACTPLGESRLHIIVRKNHPILADKNLDCISEYPYVIIENQENFGLLYDEESESLTDLFSSVPKHIISTNDSMTCQAIVAETNAFFISTTPWKHSTHYQFAGIPLEGKHNRLTFYAVTRKNMDLSPLAQSYLDSLRQLLTDL